MQQLPGTSAYVYCTRDKSSNTLANSYFVHGQTSNLLIDPFQIDKVNRDTVVATGQPLKIVATNPLFMRDSLTLAILMGGAVYGCTKERAHYTAPCQWWIHEGSQDIPGLDFIELHGSTHNVELGIILGGTSLYASNLLHVVEGKLELLPEQDRKQSHLTFQTLERLASLTSIRTILPATGTPILENGHAHLQDLLARSSQLAKAS